MFYGWFKYDDLNLAEQDSYSLANFRGGAEARNFFVEAWIRNAFDTQYVPVAFAYSPHWLLPDSSASRAAEDVRYHGGSDVLIRSTPNS